MRIVTFGEGMIEVSGQVGAAGRIAYGGDVLNTTIALARLGHRPAFMTAVGSDGWSEELLARWEADGVDCTLVARHPARVPGLYGIRVDDRGERTFTYWRDRSAARDFFALPRAAALLDAAAEADLLFLSGITLSLFDAAGRAQIDRLAGRVRERGGIVAFDGNFRPQGWASAWEADAAFAQLAGHVTIALPTIDDELLVHGHRETPQEVCARWHSRGVSEVVVKLGAVGALVSGADVQRMVPTVLVDAVDTSGAGDAFNGGYLAARLGGEDPVSAAMFANALAGETILHRGAIPPVESTAYLTVEGHRNRAGAR